VRTAFKVMLYVVISPVLGLLLLAGWGLRVIRRRRNWRRVRWTRQWRRDRKFGRRYV